MPPFHWIAVAGAAASERSSSGGALLALTLLFAGIALLILKFSLLQIKFTL